jgi:hypothetical protein
MDTGWIDTIIERKSTEAEMFLCFFKSEKMSGNQNSIQSQCGSSGNQPFGLFRAFIACVAAPEGTAF